DVISVIGVAEDRRHLVAAVGEDASQVQSDLAVAADDDNARHVFQSNRTDAAGPLSTPAATQLTGGQQSMQNLKAEGDMPWLKPSSSRQFVHRSANGTAACPASTPPTCPRKSRTVWSRRPQSIPR